MLDIKKLKNNPQLFEEKLRSKDPSVSLSSVISTYNILCEVIASVEKLQSIINTLSKEVGLLKRNNEDSSSLIEKVAEHKVELLQLSAKHKDVLLDYNTQLLSLPNIPLDDVPLSSSIEDNLLLKEFGTAPTFSFEPKNHVELGVALHLFNFEQGAKITGSGWPVYSHIGAQMEWALLQFMIDHHIENGFEMMMVPHLVKEEIMEGVGQFPKFKDQVFALNDDDYPLYLIPTAEGALNGLHRNENMPIESLPKKYFSYTPCFRREAGAHGSGERGLIRVHQFNKVEMFAFCKQEDSPHIFDEMVLSAESILEKLGLHYRSMLLSSCDMSFSGAKTVDVEVFLPGQNRYYEVSSISACEDFQSRRSKIRYKDTDGSIKFAHTLNGSGLATSRLLVAILENNQNADGSISIPDALVPYMRGLKVIQ